MSECCLTMADSLFLDSGRSFLLKCGDAKRFPVPSPPAPPSSTSSTSTSSTSSPCPSFPFSSTSSPCPSFPFSSNSSCPLRSSMKRPKAIGLQRFNFSLVNGDEFSNCHSPLLEQQQQQQQQQQKQQQQQQQLWECNRSTSDKTFERGGVGGGGPYRESSSWSSLSLSLPCLPTSSTCGQPTNILPFLYLGSQQDALSEQVIKNNGITHILNVSSTCPSSPFVAEVNFLRISVNDSHTDRLLPHFQRAFQFLDEVRASRGCALVHCLAGISRSPTLVIAYIMRSLAMTTDQAYSFVKEKRPSISPNFNFLGQLVEFERLCRQTLNGEYPGQRSNDAEYPGQRSNDDVISESAAPSCHRLPEILESEPCSVGSGLNELSSDPAVIRQDRGELTLESFPHNWETQYSTVPTGSLDQLRFTPCFAADKGSSTKTGSWCCGDQERIAVNTSYGEHSEAKSKSGRAKGRNGTRAPSRGGGGPSISAVHIGLSSINASLKSSLKSSIFKRTDHHSKSVLLID